MNLNVSCEIICKTKQRGNTCLILRSQNGDREPFALFPI